MRALQIQAMLHADKKKGFYDLIAERIALAPDGENPMDRGNRLEHDAIARFTKDTGIEVNTDLVVFAREDNESIALSPDGFIEPKKAGSLKVTEMVEVKCLNSGTHIEAYLTKKIPSDYHHQKLQYFIVNDDLQKLHWIFYDPRMPEGLDCFVHEIHRKDVQDEVELYLDYQRKILEEVDEIVNQLTF